MTKQQQFENVIHGHEAEKAAEINEIPLLEYVRLCLKADEAFFCPMEICENEDAVEKWNTEFIQYIIDNY